MIAVIILSAIFGVLLAITIFILFEINAYNEKEFSVSQRATAVLILIIWTAFSAWCIVNIRQSIIDRAINAYRNDEVTIIEKSTDGVTTDTTYRFQ